jgi:hypothetical protein
MNSSTTMSSVKKMTMPSMMMTMIVIATAFTRADFLGVAHFQVALPMTLWSRIALLERHLWRLNPYTIKSLIWRFKLTN